MGDFYCTCGGNPNIACECCDYAGDWARYTDDELVAEMRRQAEENMLAEIEALDYAGCVDCPW